MRRLILKCDPFNSAVQMEIGKYSLKFLEEKLFYRTCLINHSFN